jgi:hypothetical protein
VGNAVAIGLERVKSEDKMSRENSMSQLKENLKIYKINEIAR